MILKVLSEEKNNLKSGIENGKWIWLKKIILNGKIYILDYDGFPPSREWQRRCGNDREGAGITKKIREWQRRDSEWHEDSGIT